MATRKYVNDSLYSNWEPTKALVTGSDLHECIKPTLVIVNITADIQFIEGPGRVYTVRLSLSLTKGVRYPVMVCCAPELFVVFI